MKLLPLALLAFAGSLTAAAADRPNVVLIVADDLGFGDLGCYGATVIPTPHLDQLASRGLRLTEAYAPASTCTPSRYALLTGQYAWRQPVRKTGILDGDAPLNIDPGSTTLPALFQHAGYTTGIVGKWHLGLGDGTKPVDWNGDIAPGPLEVGFGEAFFFPATIDRVPCVLLRGHRVVGLDPGDPIAVSYGKPLPGEPSGIDDPHWVRMRADLQHSGTIIDGVSRIGYMTGGHAARWTDETMADTLLHEADGFLERHQREPFFLEYAAHEPHVPRLPNPRYAGATPLGPRGDSIAELDGDVGHLMATLDRLHLADNTLVIFTSDNGPILFDGYYDEAKERNDGHRPAGGLRGWKYLIYEGGMRVPFIVRWPGHTAPGVSDRMICLTDLLASAAALTGQTLPKGTGIDSVNVLPDLLRADAAQVRSSVVEQGISGAIALRHGDWKYIPANTGSGPSGMGSGANPNDERFREAIVPEPLLFNLRDDPDETRNLASAQPDQAAAMARELKSMLASAGQ